MAQKKAMRKKDFECGTAALGCAPAGPQGRLMTENTNPTIATLQTAAGAGGIAVILLAGPRTLEILSAIVRGRGRSTGKTFRSISPGQLFLGEIHESGQRLDETVIRIQELPDKSGHLAEINIHGGPRITQRVLELYRRQGRKSGPGRRRWWSSGACGNFYPRPEIIRPSPPNCWKP